MEENKSQLAGSNNGVDETVRSLATEILTQIDDLGLNVERRSSVRCVCGDLSKGKYHAPSVKNLASYCQRSVKIHQ